MVVKCPYCQVIGTTRRGTRTLATAVPATMHRSRVRRRVVAKLKWVAFLKRHHAHDCLVSFEYGILKPYKLPETHL